MATPTTIELRCCQPDDSACADEPGDAGATDRDAGVETSDDGQSNDGDGQSNDGTDGQSNDGTDGQSNDGTDADAGEERVTREPGGCAVSLVQRASGLIALPWLMLAALVGVGVRRRRH